VVRGAWGPCLCKVVCLCLFWRATIGHCVASLFGLCQLLPHDPRLIYIMVYVRTCYVHTAHCTLHTAHCTHTTHNTHTTHTNTAPASSIQHTASSIAPLHRFDSQSIGTWNRRRRPLEKIRRRPTCAAPQYTPISLPCAPVHRPRQRRRKSQAAVDFCLQ
jgi:hypothetical protein